MAIKKFIAITLNLYIIFHSFVDTLEILCNRCNLSWEHSSLYCLWESPLSRDFLSLPLALLASAFQLAFISSSISAAHGALHAPLELHHNGIKSHQTMVSQGLVRFFPSLVFLSFSVLFSSSSSSFLFFFHIYRSLSIIVKFIYTIWWQNYSMIDNE